MFIESGALYSVWGLIYVVSKARNSQVQNIVLQILNQVVVSLMLTAHDKAESQSDNEMNRKFRPNLSSSA